MEATKQHHYELTAEMSAIMKKSLDKKRWAEINLGAPEKYTHTNMINRWNLEKNKWLNVSGQSCGLMACCFRNK